ncbi:hypothetical protein [Rhodopila sp.]|uniref:hypothetical protein n=1 Tax=Rhodopila sp. TaxID=2480087 RepID=UPI003D0E24AB
MEDQPFTLSPAQSAAFERVRAFIKVTPEVESLLYDIDLLPEQILCWRADIGERDWYRMMLVVGHFMVFAERLARPSKLAPPRYGSRNCGVMPEPSQITERPPDPAPMRPMTREEFYRAEAERRVLRMRGSADAPGFEACVQVEIGEMRGRL